MKDEKIISGDGNSIKSQNEKIIGSEGDNIIKPDPSKSGNIIDRIRKSTEIKGLKNTPVGFDEPDGDWKSIKSDNPFEVLYLDYKQHILITPEIIKNNYDILYKFWNDKVGILNTGGNRVLFKNKFGDGTVENSLLNLKKAFDKLSSPNGIENYFSEVNNLRLKNGENKLRETIEDMLVDGVVEPSEIDLRLDRGKNYDLSKEEVALIIEKAIEKNNLKPYGKPVGDTLIEKLLSVTWMTEIKLKEQQKLDEEKKKRGREIFDNVYAHSLEEIGTILFENENSAKDYIRKGLIINSIDYFSSARANQILDISQKQKNEHLKYLQIAYRLNQKLPYRFNKRTFENIDNLIPSLFDQFDAGKEHFIQGNIGIWLNETQPELYKTHEKIFTSAGKNELSFFEFIYTIKPDLPFRFTDTVKVKNPKELAKEFLENQEIGKKHLKQGAVEIWFKLTQQENYNMLKKIGETAENSDLAFLEFIYSFNPELPYIFNKKHRVKNPEELCSQINKSSADWEAGKSELFNSSILIWLQTTGYALMVKTWETIRTSYQNKRNEGLEKFLHLLNEKIVYPKISSSKGIINIPWLEGGKISNTEIVFSNISRGYISGDLSFSKNIDGLSLSEKEIQFNYAAGIKEKTVNFKADTANLTRGSVYKTKILLKTSLDETLEIPVTVKVVFPLFSFLKEIAKYTVLFALIGLALRSVVFAFGFKTWLNSQFPYFLNFLDVHWQSKPQIFYFPVIFLILYVLIGILFRSRKSIIRMLNKL